MFPLGESAVIPDVAGVFPIDMTYPTKESLHVNDLESSFNMCNDIVERCDVMIQASPHDVYEWENSSLESGEPTEFAFKLVIIYDWTAFRTPRGSRGSTYVNLMLASVNELVVCFYYPLTVLCSWQAIDEWADAQPRPKNKEIPDVQ